MTPSDDDILFLHVLAYHDPGTGLTEFEIMRAIDGMSEEQRQHIIVQARKNGLDIDT